MIVFPTWSNGNAAIRPFAAELTLIGTIVAILLTPFFTPRRSNVPCGLVALLGTIIALLSLLGNHSGGQNFGGQNFGGQYFGGLLLSDPASIFWKGILLLFVIGVIVLWFSATSGTMREGDGPEFFALLLGATLGMCFMASTSNWLMLILSMELTSLPSYVLAGFRKTNRLGAEASLKYVLFGAACNAFMAYGLSLLYGISGSLQFDHLPASGHDTLLAIALLGVLAGVGFKIAAVPFHFWCPDVFEGASIDVTAFLSVASKGAALLVLLRIAANLPPTMLAHGSATAVAIGVIGAITATVGNTGAFIQTNIKRLLGYSSIAQAGYIVCAIVAVFGGSSSATTQAVLFYLLAYLFMNLGAFTVASVVAKDASSGGETIADYAGLGKRSPLLAVCMTVCLISLIGLPPLAGFNAKLNVMVLLGSGGGWWWALVAAIGINTVLSMYFYLRIVKTMYFNDSDRPALAANVPAIVMSVGCAGMLLFLFVAFGPASRWVAACGQLLH